MEEESIDYLGKNHVSIFHFDNREEFLEELEKHECNTNGYCHSWSRENGIGPVSLRIFLMLENGE